MTAGELYSILIVDDDPIVVRVMGNMLAEFSPLRFATSGTDALLLARRAVPDLVVLDVEMPGLGGFEVCKAFKADPLLAAVPIIFLTSHQSMELETIGLQLGAVDFITKPPHAALVLARVRAQIEVKRLSDTLRGSVRMDFLTGTSNRLEFEKTLHQEWERACRSADTLCLLLMEIDGFAGYCAEHADEDSDSVLREVANALRSAIFRPSDLLARYANGTFAGLLPQTDSLGAAAVARRAIQAVDQLRISLTAADSAVCLSLSVGIASCRTFSHASPADSDRGLDVAARPSDPTKEALIAAAEQALAATRAAGGHGSSTVEVGRPPSKHVALLPADRHRSP
ncbi:MAG: diguanylate cyclase [Gammaproteobacteria bacterium]|nr:diguanylate cyclase [Gammaproteobacteria bacterium]